MATFNLTANADFDAIGPAFLSLYLRISNRAAAANDNGSFSFASGFIETNQNLTFFGTGLVFQRGSGGIVDILAGRITSLTYVYKGETVITATGLSTATSTFSAAALWDAVISDNTAAIESLLLGQADTVNGSAIRDIVDSLGGNDRLFGNGGNDKLTGGFGNDTIHGDRGRDELTGAAGSDRFVFDIRPAGGNADVITDYTPGIDRFALDNGVISGLGGNGTLAAAKFHLGRFAADVGDRIIYDRANGDIWYDPDGQGGMAKVLLAEVDNGTALTAGSFLIL